MRRRIIACAVLTLATLTAAPARAADTVTVVAVGDIAYYTSGAQSRTAKLTTALNPTLVLLAGDLTYGHKVAGYWRASSKSEFKRKFIARKWGSVLAHYPTWAVPGNHEYGPGTRAAGYRYLVKRYHLPKTAGDLWWSRKLVVGSGSWLVIGLDSEGLNDSAKLERERAFIRTTLAANAGVPTVVMWHRPRFSKGQHGDQTDAGVKMLWQETTSDSDVKLAIWGHDHDFEQETETGVSGSQVTTIVAGTGGAELRGCRGEVDPTISNSLVCGTASATFQNYGVVQLTFTTTGFSWKYRMLSPTVATGTVVASGSRTITTS